MALFGALGQWIGLTLTLAGVTGIIVSVGITADSYIVYFERIKENVRGGYEIDEAANEGFSAAFRTILTADTVSLISAVLLYTLAVGAVKGFALALGMATVLDILIARFFTKRAVGLLAETRLGSGGRFSIEGAAK
jgi:preprotein translocase subunit SecD